MNRQCIPFTNLSIDPLLSGGQSGTCSSSLWSWAGPHLIFLEACSRAPSCLRASTPLPAGPRAPIPKSSGSCSTPPNSGPNTTRPTSSNPRSGGSVAMVNLGRILKDYHESGALNALIAIHAALDDVTFLTKSGDLVTILAARGADYECLDAPQLDQIARRFE